MFAFALVLGVINYVVSAILALRLMRSAPQLHAASDSPTGWEWWPFWTLAFLSPKMWRQLPAGLKPLAGIAVATLVASVALLVIILLRFVIGGGGL